MSLEIGSLDCINSGEKAATQSQVYVSCHLLSLVRKKLLHSKIILKKRIILQHSFKLWKVCNTSATELQPGVASFPMVKWIVLGLREEGSVWSRT